MLTQCLSVRCVVLTNTTDGNVDSNVEVNVYSLLLTFLINMFELCTNGHVIVWITPKSDYMNIAWISVAVV